MSNHSGSVDLVREQERQARQQLLDEFRDPSPQPIFSQPVKVELEDETSRRIKDTLGDFNQVQHVLINDPKHLIGISRSGAAATALTAAATAASRSTAFVDHGGGGTTTWSSRNHATSNGLSRTGGNISNGHHVVSKRPPQPVNGLHKPHAGLDSSSLPSRRPHPSANVKSGASVDKKHPPQQGAPKHRSEHPPKINPISRGYSSSVGHTDQPPPPPPESGTRTTIHQDRSIRPSHHQPQAEPVVSEKGQHEHTSNHHRRRTNNSDAGGGANVVNGDTKSTVSQNGSSTSLPNGVAKHHRTQRIPDQAAKKFPGSSGGKHPPLPPKLTIPTQEERRSEIEVETILREMKQAVPPPLTGIQTPRTEENGFAFPSLNSSEKDFSRVLEQLGHHAVPSTPPPVPPERVHTTSKKSPHPPFNLQADLEMSDSDDDGIMVPACKNPQVSEIDPFTKCPPPPLNHDENSGLGSSRVGSHVQAETQAPGKKAIFDSGCSNGVGGPVLSALSSSSESSDSEDSCSESNESDSSASSEASEQEAPAEPAPQMWNLSNFFDETRRNHSPAFMALDTNTNSSISTAVKEEQPPASVQPPGDKDSFSLADEDSVSCILGKYSDHYIKEYLESPINDLFSMETGPMGIKAGVLSPIPTSPVPAPPPPVPRGPRTPPTPPDPPAHSKLESDEDEDEDDDAPLNKKQLKAGSRRPVMPKTEIRSEPKRHQRSTPGKVSEHKSHRSRNEQFFSSRSKKKSSSRTKESISPVVPPSTDSKRQTDNQFHPDPHSRVSSNSRDTSRTTYVDDTKNSLQLSASSSCPVPSVPHSTTKSTHRSPIKSHHKHSSPAIAASSSFSSPSKKRTSGESKEVTKGERVSSTSKSSARSKQSFEHEESARSRNSSLTKSEKESSSLTDSNATLSSSKHDKSRDAKSKHGGSSSKTKNSTSKAAGSRHSSPQKSSTPKKSKVKPVKSSSRRSSSHNEEENRKVEKKKKSSKKFSIKNFLQSPTISRTLDIKDLVSPIRVSGSEDFSPPPPPPPVQMKSSESSPLHCKEPEEEEEDIRPSETRNFIPKGKTSKRRKSSTSSSSRSRSRSASGTRLSSSEKSKVKKKSTKSMKRRTSKLSSLDLNSSIKKRHHDAKHIPQPPQKSSLSSSSMSPHSSHHSPVSVAPHNSSHHSPASVAPHNSNHHSPATTALDLEIPSHPPELLSPIRSCNKEESAITSPPPPSPLPNAVMVSILFSKLLRIPEGHHLITPPTLKPPKDRPPEDNCHQKASVVSSPSRSLTVTPAIPAPSPLERRSTSSASPSKRDIKTKSRTESSKSSKTGKSHTNIEKSSKSVLNSQSEAANPNKGNGVSTIFNNTSCDKTSIRSGADAGPKLTKTGQDCPNTKKRKVEEAAPESTKKKPKIITSKSSSPAEADCKEKILIVKSEKLDLNTINDKRLTSKDLERCDSPSSLSSLCSQMSHKSSKSFKERSKENLKDGQETKKPKSTTPPVKEIKREKEERPKTVIKKEPGSVSKAEKIKSKSKDRSSVKGSSERVSENKKVPETSRNEVHTTSSQVSYWDGSCKIEETKPQPTNHQRLLPSDLDTSSDWDHFAPEIQQELRGVPNHLNKVTAPVPSEYYWQEGKKLKNMAEKEKNPIQQALKYFEATVMFILTSLHRELPNKDPDSIYQIYRETLRFTSVIRSGIQKRLSPSTPGNIDFKILILCLKCQSLLHLKLYNLKLKEVKEQHKGVSDFMHSSSSKVGSHCSPLGSSYSRNMSQPSPCQPRIGGGGGAGSVPSPHSPTPSPAGSVASVGSQSSGYSSSEVNGTHSRPHSTTLLQLPLQMTQLGTVSVPQNMFDVMAKHHSHLSNLHMCHELWEQADMYMTRSNSKDFFKEVADKSEKLSLHSNIKELVSYLQTGLSLLKSHYC